jgi:tRNA(Ile)-lysidine synthase
MKIEHEFKSVIDSSNTMFFYVACSGGVDSMVLLYLAKKYKLPIHILHVNYNLRGIESTKDAAFLNEYCLKNNLPISIHEVQLKEQLLQNGGNLQNEARKIRYEFFKDKLNENQKSKLLIAHHLDDQIETFWLQLYRGSGLKGMAGMKQFNGDFVRPLLNISKKDLINYAALNHISWREDQSNSTLDYQRNLWRNEYIPFSSSQIESITDSVLFLQQLFRENLSEISDKISKVVNEINNYNYIKLNTLSEFEIIDIIELFRSLSVPSHQVKPFLQLFNAQKGSKIKWENSTGNFLEIIREEHGFSFTRIDNEISLPNLKIELIDILPSTFDKTTFYFDSEKIIGELKIRFWQKGDRVHPIGLQGSKLISDVITHAKVLNTERKRQLVICDDEKILACVGLCVDRRAIASRTSSNVRVSLQN